MEQRKLSVAEQNTKYGKNVLLFELNDSLSVSEFFGRYPMASAPRNPNKGPVFAKCDSETHTIIVRGYKWVSYSFDTLSERVVFTDATGTISVPLQFFKQKAWLYEYPDDKYIPKNTHKSNL